MKFYHILLSLGIGALLDVVVSNIFGLVGADTIEVTFALIAFIVCFLVYIMFYLNNIKKTLSEENDKLMKKIEDLEGKLISSEDRTESSED